MSSSLPRFEFAGPEIVLALGAMVVLLFGAARPGRSRVLLSHVGALCILVLALAALVLLPGGRQVTFSGTFVLDDYAKFWKALALVAAMFGLACNLNFGAQGVTSRSEYPALILLACVGMCLMISANDIMVAYLGLELMSLALYVLAAFDRDDARSSEAGLKYFVLGALSSGLLLYGASLIYGFAGSTGFEAIASALRAGERPAIGLLVGLVFLMVGFAFKISAVPFHMWTPDVYQGAPTPVTAFFAAAPKVAAMALMVRVLFDGFPHATAAWQQMVVFLAVASMVLGSFAAIGQTDLKRLLAYSSIANMGFALVAVAAGTETGVRGVMIFMVIYVAMTVGAFALLLLMRTREGPIVHVNDLAGLSRTQPFLAFAFAMLMVSMIGVPPLAGFFGKYVVFLAAIEAKLFALSVIGVLASAVGAFYYLRVIKVMYFDEPVGEPVQASDPALRGVVIVSLAFILLFVFVPGPLYSAVQVAARSLF